MPDPLRSRGAQSQLLRARWLLLKDLQILRRSPLQAFLLVAYPVLIAVLVGFAISREPSKPRVALLNEIPAGERVSVGGRQLPAVGVGVRICQRVECVHVKDRPEAVEEVRSGDVLAALILPSDLVEQINSLSTLNPGIPRVEVILNEEDPVKAQLVNDRIESLLAQANLLIARRIAVEGGHYLNLLVNGGGLQVIGQTFHILGLRTSAQILGALRPAMPRGPLRSSLDEVIRFANLSRENLDVAGPLIDRLAQPIEVDKQVLSAATPPLEVFAVAVAATFTLTFVTVLLVAGSLALEREENAFSRLTRGLVSPSALLGEKVALGMGVGLIVTLLMLAGLQTFVPLHWSRIGLWLVAILAASGALAAAGAALGAAAREVRAVSLLAFMVSLPIAFLSLIPSGVVGAGLYGAIKLLTALFPFKPALEALSAALNSGGSGLGGPLAHLVVLIVAYGLIARLALRRFASV
jgi:ABC-type multidrug transport system permease subunit